MHSNRKSLIRKHIILSNGQIMTITFKRRNVNELVDNINRVWHVSLIIGNSKKYNRLWDINKLKSKKNLIKQTGKCGLEGLKKALDIILDFRDNLKHYEELQIGWEDEKRKKAYKYLTKYDFFLSSEDYCCYYSRNPKYWEKVKEIK